MSHKDVDALAALATFRQIYNDNEDVFYIISKFVENIISENKISRFSLTSMRQWLYENYNFEIPDKVISKSIRTYLKDSVKLQDNEYFVDFKKIDRTIYNDLEKYKNLNINISELLYKYVEEKCEKTLNSKDKKEIFANFIDYVRGSDKSGKWCQYISSFCITNQANQEVFGLINRIKEGSILYSGIIFSPDINDSIAWKKELTVFLELDILFYLAGYNGEVYKKYVLDMIQLIKEINSRKSGKKIFLKYFEDTQKEIDNFFSVAAYKIRNDQVSAIDNTAMQSILEGCLDPSDVMFKKTKFYNLLDRYEIEEYSDCSYYDEANHKYNVASSSIIDKLELDDSNLKYLNHINYSNIIRKDNGSKFIKECNCIVLSEAWIPTYIDKEIKDGNKHAINMEMLTNALWFDLGKGFGKNSIPSNFDIIIKSEIVLSSVLNKTVSSQYDDLVSQLDKGKISKEDAEKAFVNLKCDFKKPEEINPDNVEETLDKIKLSNVRNLNIKNLRYKEENDLLKFQYNKLTNEKDSACNNLEIEKSKNEELIRKVNKMEQDKQILKNKVIDGTNFWTRALKTILSIIFVGFCIAAIILSILFDPGFIIIGIIPLICSAIFYTYGLITVKSLSPLKVYENLLMRYSDWVKRGLCKKYNIKYFDDRELS